MIGKRKSILVGLLFVCIVCVGIVAILLNLSDIQRAWTKRKIPEVENRFQKVLEDVSGASWEHEALDFNLINPYVPSRSPKDCIIALANYSFGTNIQLDNLSDLQSEYFQDKGYISIEPTIIRNGYLAFRNHGDTLRFFISIPSDIPEKWSRFDTVYMMSIEYREPSIEYCSGRPINDLNKIQNN